MITLPTISPQVMKKYPLYILITFLGIIAGYYINSESRTKREEAFNLKQDNRRLIRSNDSLNQVISDFKDALLIQNGIISNYKAVVEKTDSLTNKSLRKPAAKLLKLTK